LENAAKFRAVEQHVGTYDEFKAIVDGCHLKPLDRKEEIDSILKPNEHKWNNVAPPSEDNEKTQTKPSNEVDPNNLNQNLNLEKIQIYGDFERLWRKVKRDSKKSGDLLLNLEESSVFKENCEPLDEIIKRLEAFSSDEITQNQTKIMSILESISKSKRFSVSIAFMDNSAFKSASSLFSKLNHPDAVKLEKCFK